MGNSFLGTHCHHHSGAAIPRAEVIFAQAKPAGSVPWVTYYHWPRVQISTLDTLLNRSLRTHPYLLLHQIYLRVWTPNEIEALRGEATTTQFAVYSRQNDKYSLKALLHSETVAVRVKKPSGDFLMGKTPSYSIAQKC